MPPFEPACIGQIHPPVGQFCLLCDLRVVGKNLVQVVP
jgi:hypothetical protein